MPAQQTNIKEAADVQNIHPIKPSFRRRTKYLRSRTDRDWHDARNYHLCLDSESTDFESAANALIALAKKMKSRIQTL